MLKSSQQLGLQGKTVLVIAAGGYPQQFVWNAYKEFGIQVCLVDVDASSLASSKASYFLGYDFRDHKEDENHAIKIIELIHEMGLKVDGCVTFLDDCGPLTAIICHFLCLPGAGKRAAQVAKTKSVTHNALREKMSNTMENSDVYRYTAKCFPINGSTDINNAIAFVGVPAVLKLEHGTNSYGVEIVKDSRKCKEAYQKMKSELSKENDRFETGLGHGLDFMLMEFIDGTHHSVDIVLFQGDMILAVVSDCSIREKGTFILTAASMPTSLRPEHEEQLVNAARQCCSGIGLMSGVFNVELKMALNGPKLIEINGRMGGHYLRDWILNCYGIDLLLLAFMVSVGIRPENVKPRAKCQIMGVYCCLYAHKSHMQKENTLATLSDMINRGIIQYSQLLSSFEDCEEHGDETPICVIAVMDSDKIKAKHKLLHVCDVLGLNINGYDYKYILNCYDDK